MDRVVKKVFDALEARLNDDRADASMLTPWRLKDIYNKYKTAASMTESKVNSLCSEVDDLCVQFDSVNKMLEPYAELYRVRTTMDKKLLDGCRDYVLLKYLGIYKYAEFSVPAELREWVSQYDECETNS